MCLQKPAGTIATGEPLETHSLQASSFPWSWSRLLSEVSTVWLISGILKHLYEEKGLKTCVTNKADSQAHASECTISSHSGSILNPPFNRMPDRLKLRLRSPCRSPATKERQKFSGVVALMKSFCCKLPRRNLRRKEGVLHRTAYNSESCM